VEVRLCNAYQECLRSINVGEPISPDKKTEYTSQFARWAAIITGADGVKPVQSSKKGLFSWGQKKG
jgi:hypothetical protein